MKHFYSYLAGFVFFLFLATLLIFVKGNELKSSFSFLLNNFSNMAAPHGTCNSCHINHTSSGSQLTMVGGNANLCMSCHNPVGTASTMPFTNAMKAVPGVSGNSHSWNKNSVNTLYETNITTNTEMLLRVINDTIVCSTCHNQHSQTYPPFLRTSNTGDAMCKNCHTARDIKRYADNPLNKGSHPVGITYNVADPRLNVVPLNSMILIDSKVECSSCHSLHNAVTNDGNLLRQTNNDFLCKSCHAYGDHKGMTCSKCHKTHNTDKTNIFMVNNNIVTPSSGVKSVILTAQSGANSYADADATYNGICEVCHTSTSYHKNDGTGVVHNNAANCITCHTHKNNFLHGGDCRKCHGHDSGYEYNPGLFCQGNGTVTSHSVHTEIDADDQIGPNINCEACHDTANFPFFKTGTDINSDGKFDLSETDVCNNCHSNGGLFDGVNDVQIGAKNNWVNGVYSGNNLLAGKNNWCAGCHDADQSSSNQDGTGVLAPDVAGDGTSYGYYYSGHGKNSMVLCSSCHDYSLRHLDGNVRTYTYQQSIANLGGTEYRTGYRLTKVNNLEPMRIPLNDPLIQQFDSANYRLCTKCHNWDNLMGGTLPFSTNFNHSGTNAGYSFGYGVASDRNNHLNNHLNFLAHSRVEPYWDSDWDFTTTAVVTGSVVPEINGYDSYISCVTCHDVHGGQLFGGNTGGNMMRDGRLQGRQPGFKYTYLIPAPGGLPNVTSVGANRSNSIGGVFRGGVDYRAGYSDVTPQTNVICGECHKEQYPTTDEYNATGNAGTGCTPCHPFTTSNNYFMEFYRIPSSSCALCHSVVQDNGDGIPVGGRRAVMGEFPNGNTHAHYGTTLDETDCIVCHDLSLHTNGYVDLVDGDNSNVIYHFLKPDSLPSDPDVSNFCQSCHDSNGATRLASPLNPFGNGNTPPNIASKFSGTLQWNELYGDFCWGTEGTMRGVNSHHDISDADQLFSGAKLECLNCHGAHLASQSSPLADPFNLNTSWVGTSNGFCLSCHNGGTGPASPGFPSSVKGPTIPLRGLESCNYGGSPWWVDYRWTNCSHGPNSKRGWTGYSGAPQYNMFCLDCHDSHGSYTATNTLGNPYIIRDVVNGTSYVDDGERYTGPWYGPPWNTFGISRTVKITITGLNVGWGGAQGLCNVCHANWYNASPMSHDCEGCQFCHGHGQAYGEYDWVSWSNDLPCPAKKSIEKSNNKNFKPPLHLNAQ